MKLQHPDSRNFSSARLLWRSVLITLVGFGLTLSVAQAEEIGTVTTARAGAFAERNGKTRALRTGNRIDSADVLKTDATGRLSIKLKDGTVMSLGPNSELAANEIELDEDEAVPERPLNQPTRAGAPSKPSWDRGAATVEAGTSGADKGKDQGNRKKWPLLK